MNSLSAIVTEDFGLTLRCRMLTSGKSYFRFWTRKAIPQCKLVTSTHECTHTWFAFQFVRVCLQQCKTQTNLSAWKRDYIISEQFETDANKHPNYWREHPQQPEGNNIGRALAFLKNNVWWKYTALQSSIEICRSQHSTESPWDNRT